MNYLPLNPETRQKPYKAYHIDLKPKMEVSLRGEGKLYDVLKTTIKYARGFCKVFTSLKALDNVHSVNM